MGIARQSNFHINYHQPQREQLVFRSLVCLPVFVSTQLHSIYNAVILLTLSSDPLSSHANDTILRVDIAYIKSMHVKLLLGTIYLFIIA